MAPFQPLDYPAAASLLAAAPLNELGPGAELAAWREVLAGLTPERLTAPRALADVEAARACLAGLWLRGDFLDESHTLSQSLSTVEGSCWHGIMHRREPDADNAKYWFRRVGRHEVFEPLAEEARELAAAGPRDRASEFLVAQAAWDPFRFIDLCDAMRRTNGPHAALCRAIQRREWELLFDYCYRRAAGSH